jgi:hypothetical protein
MVVSEAQICTRSPSLSLSLCFFYHIYLNVVLLKEWFQSVKKQIKLFIIIFGNMCNFLYFVSVFCALCANHSPLLLETRVRLNRGDEAFRKSDFTQLFLFLMYDVYVTTVSSLIK